MDVLQWEHVCHCRICQPATGGPFTFLVGAPKDQFRPATSAYCPDCGTPLGSVYNRQGASQCVTIGSLDPPEAVVLEEQLGIESKLPFVGVCENLPKKATGEGQTAEGPAFLAQLKPREV